MPFLKYMYDNINFFCLQISDTNNDPFFVWLIQFSTAFLLYLVSKFACKAHIQKFSFAFPIIFVMPLSIVGILGMLFTIKERRVIFLY